VWQNVFCSKNIIFFQVRQGKGKSPETPVCLKCSTPTTITACDAKLLLARGILPEGEGTLLLFKHEGTHTCSSLDKKSKQTPTEETKAAINEALPGFGELSTEKLRIGATANVFNKMLTGQENTTLDDVLNIAEAVQDERTLNDVVRGSKSSKYVPHREQDVEVKQLKRRLEELGLRALLFDTYEHRRAFCNTNVC